MSNLNIEQPCPKCFGDGVHEKNTPGGVVVIDPCPLCGGSGKRVLSTLNVGELLDNISDMQDKINDILDKCNDIFEKVSE